MEEKSKKMHQTLFLKKVFKESFAVIKVFIFESELKQFKGWGLLKIICVCIHHTHTYLPIPRNKQVIYKIKNLSTIIPVLLECSKSLQELFEEEW